MENTTSKPFSQSYVIRTTARNMRKAVDFSIKKTMDRMMDFKDNHLKSNEVFTTLARLQAIRGQIDALSENEETQNG